MEVAMPRSHHRHNSSIGSMSASMTTTTPAIEMVPNPSFAFPMKPRTPSPSGKPYASRRPASMHLTAPTAQDTRSPHKRAVSTLPSFTFNAADASGHSHTPPLPADEAVPITPSRRGHTRVKSEFVGGNSRLGISNAISTSPTKTAARQMPLSGAGAGIPAEATGNRGHKHRRSAALSSQNVGSIMLPADTQPRLSSSLPSTPLEHPPHRQTPSLDRTVSAPTPGEETAIRPDPFGPALNELSARPVSRRVVGFSDNVEIIPRPLSTISSGTEASVSTLRGHSVDNSISSMLSLGTPSPPSSRPPRRSPSTVSEAETETRSKARSSLEVGRRIEKEGEWLKSESSNLHGERPLSEPSATSPSLSFVQSEPPRQQHSKRQSLGHALGLDRRRSEPSISTSAGGSSRLSPISLQEGTPSVPALPNSERARLERKPSTKKIRAWAAAKMSRKAKDANKVGEKGAPADVIRPESTGSVNVLGKVPMVEPPVAEMDLDAVFNSQDAIEGTERVGSPPQPRFEVSTPTPSHSSSFSIHDLDDTSLMVDLDAALGPNRTPPMSSGTSRRERLHSNRREIHRRSESLPVMPAFEFGGRISTPSQTSMADVFEEDEEEEVAPVLAVHPNSQRCTQEEVTGIGISIVDAVANTQGSSLHWGVNDGLRIQRGEREQERPSASYGNMSSSLSTSNMDRRASSIIEETIVEESSPVDAPVESVEVVEAHEEPRAASLTKSSDSSETPTLLAAQPDMLGIPDGQQSLMTPETYETSTFSSPDFGRRQGSFDTSRLGTSASSVTDDRTMSSCHTGEQGQEVRMSVEDVPSLTSSRSTIISTMHANSSRREFSDRTTSGTSATLDPAVAAGRRRKRASIQSLSQLVGGSFSGRSKLDVSRPQTASATDLTKVPKKTEHRLKKLMFWKSRQSTRQASVSGRPAPPPS